MKNRASYLIIAGNSTSIPMIETSAIGIHKTKVVEP